MKNTVFYFIFLFTIACSSKKDKIAKKWNVKSIEIAGQNLEGDMVNGFYFELKSDGNYLIKGMNEEAGTWAISQNNDSLITTNDKNRRVAYLITELSDKNLSIVDYSVGDATITHFSVE